MAKKAKRKRSLYEEIAATGGGERIQLEGMLKQEPSAELFEKLTENLNNELTVGQKAVAITSRRCGGIYFGRA